MATLEERVQRLEDIREIRNLIGKHSYLFGFDRAREYQELWSHDAADAAWELEARGVYEGQESLKRYFLANADVARDPRAPLRPAQHLLLNDYIIVAGDGQTAKGVWLGMGFVVANNGPNNTPRSEWASDRYGVDFIKENGRWKFYRFRIYHLFNTSYYKSWVQTSRENGGGPARSPDQMRPQATMPDRPTTADEPYALKNPASNLPRMPEPYRTFKETFSYIPYAS